MTLPAAVVDIHSHIFNAEDLPIDGFVKTLAPTPRLLTGVLSVPLDRLTQWRATAGRNEAARLRSLLRGEEAITLGPVEAELVSDEELLALMRSEWQRQGLVAGTTAGLEATVVADPTAELSAALQSAPPTDVRELEGWLEEWNPDLRAQFEASAQEEGLIGDAWRKIGAAKEAVACFVRALRLVTRDRHLIAAELARTYSKVVLFTPALVDFSSTTSDRPSTDIGEQISVHSLVAKVSIAGQLPGAPEARVAPFVGYDPHREVAETGLRDWNPDRGAPNAYIPYGAGEVYHRGIAFDPAKARALQVPEGPWEEAALDLRGVRGALDLVRHAIECGGFLGVKLYPPSGFHPLGNALRFPGTTGEQLDAALRSLYGYCVAMDVPVLAHAAHSNEFEAGYNGFAGPAGWELVLSEFPDLRLCLGHFGHMHGVGADPTKPSLDGWARRFLALMETYPNVYADVGNSKLPLSAAYRANFVSLLRALLDSSSTLARRLLYGSDYWMNTLTPGHDRFLSAFEEALAETFDDAAREGFMGRNALRFLGFTNDLDEPADGNRNRARWKEFHGPHPTPVWFG